MEWSERLRLPTGGGEITCRLLAGPHIKHAQFNRSLEVMMGACSGFVAFGGPLFGGRPHGNEAREGSGLGGDMAEEIAPERCSLRFS